MIAIAKGHSSWQSILQLLRYFIKSQEYELHGSGRVKVRATESSGFIAWKTMSVQNCVPIDQVAQ